MREDKLQPVADIDAGFYLRINKFSASTLLDYATHSLTPLLSFIWFCEMQ